MTPPSNTHRFEKMQQLAPRAYTPGGFCKGIPEPDSPRKVSSLSSPVLCGAHRNAVLHGPREGKGGYSRCFVELFKEGQQIAR